MDNTIVIKLLALFGSLALIHQYMKPDVVESYFGVGPAQTIRAQQVTRDKNNSFFEVPGNYQAMLAPRLSNVNYGAFIRYNTPQVKNLAIDPKDPMMLRNVGVSGLYNEPQGPTPVVIKENYANAVDMLPVAGMQGMQDVNAMGDSMSQPIIYDRMIYANQRSKLYGLGDPIRGDLPIVPLRNEWFRPAVSPNIDLRDGAIFSIAGIDNSSQKELMALRSASAGGLLGTGSGINYSVMQSPYATAAGTDVNVSAFP